MIKLFTHNDLDGVSCAIIAILAFGKENVDINYCDYTNINEQVKSFINSDKVEQYENIFITDISITEEIAKEIDNKHLPIALLDHHESSKVLNQFNWAISKEKNSNGINTCGTELFFNWLLEHDCMKYNTNIRHYVEAVRDYDTYRFKNENNMYPKQLNDIFHIVGYDEFIEDIIKLLEANLSVDIEANPTWKILLNIEQKKINSDIDSCEKNMSIGTLEYSSDESYTYGFVIATNYISEIGNELNKKHPELDLIIILGRNSLSYRTIHKNVRCDLIAKKFGGGGHPMSAGSPIDFSLIKNALLI